MLHKIHENQRCHRNQNLPNNESIPRVLVMISYYLEMVLGERQTPWTYFHIEFAINTRPTIQ